MAKLTGSYDYSGETPKLTWREVDEKGWISPNPATPQVGDIVTWAPRGWQERLPEGVRAEYHHPEDTPYNRWGQQPSVAGLPSDYYKLVAA